MNRWNIADRLERDIIERDTSMYCGLEFDERNANRRDRPLGSTSSMTHALSRPRIL
jgi:hypothetical protein